MRFEHNGLLTHRLVLQMGRAFGKMDLLVVTSLHGSVGGAMILLVQISVWRFSHF